MKTRTSDFYAGAAAVDDDKQNAIRRVSELFLQKRDAEDLDRRYDIIEVILTPNGKFISINHLKNAF